jgi:hypothetical protein
MGYATTLALGSQPKKGYGNVWAENATWESHSHSQDCEGVKEWAHTFPNGLPLWELEFIWGPCEVLNI